METDEYWAKTLDAGMEEIQEEALRRYGAAEDGLPWNHEDAQHAFEAGGAFALSTTIQALKAYWHIKNSLDA